MKFKPNWLQPGTIVDASDRKYIVTTSGWRVYEYKESHWYVKKLVEERIPQEIQ